MADFEVRSKNHRFTIATSSVCDNWVGVAKGVDIPYQQLLLLPKKATAGSTSAWKAKS